MNIARTRLTPYALPLLRQWQAGGTGFTTRRGWLLELEAANGTIGYGDCAPLPSHGTETGPTAHTTLQSTLPELTRISPEQGLEQLPEPASTPAARCALESALLDLLSKQQGLPLHRWLNPESNARVKVNASIGILDDVALKRARTALEHGYSTLKLKIGSPDPEHEIQQLRHLCATLPEGVQLRLDANRAWDTSTAKSYLKQLQGLPIESLEEPLAQADIDSLIRLQNESDITLALDETTAQLSIDDLPQLTPLHRLILKPMVQGGLLPCMQLGRRALELGIDVVVTSTVDSAAGVWAATQVADALDTTGKLCHGLGTGEWLQHDLGACPEINKGRIKLPEIPGLGFTPSG